MRVERGGVIRRGTSVIFGIASGVALVCCTTYGADSTGPEHDAGTVRPGADAAGDSSSPTAAGDASSDAAANADALVSPDACAVEPGAPCARAEDCCSSSCNEERECVTSCKSVNSACGVSDFTSCCVGLWCVAQTFKCGACVPSGRPAADAGGTPLAHSCCSRALQDGSGVCQ